jgi:hypothetical protein
MSDDATTAINEEIARKEALEQPRTALPLAQRVELHHWLESARISLAEADEKNRDLGGTIEEVMPLVEDAAEAILKASELLEEQAKLLR